MTNTSSSTTTPPLTSTTAATATARTSHTSLEIYTVGTTSWFRGLPSVILSGDGGGGGGSGWAAGEPPQVYR
ncbi:hypothetical protein E2C01_034170 [Portunus trituberculatus]|uniref:Uncharacterized protein n=1 Tax=Portunus trituberculatus TaxID=210409 RepID=A0A5B7F678_PORTR|nr:hypothetical protein [Portunus trituberculatus]